MNGSGRNFLYESHHNAYLKVCEALEALRGPTRTTATTTSKAPMWDPRLVERLLLESKRWKRS